MQNERSFLCRLRFVRSNILLTWLVAWGFTMLIPWSASAAISTEQQAREIVEGYFNRVNNYQTLSTRLQITNYKKGKARQQAEAHLWQQQGDTTHTLSIITKPKLRKGIKLLTVDNSVGEDQQWVHYPVTGRFFKVKPSRQYRRFLGSQMTFEDLKLWRPEDFNLDLADSTSEQQNIVVVNALPKDPDQSIYTKQQLHINTKTGDLQRIDLFDRRDINIKRIDLDQYQQVAPDISMPTRWLVTNLKNRKATETLWLDTRINPTLPTDLFEITQVRRRDVNGQLPTPESNNAD